METNSDRKKKLQIQREKFCEKIFTELKSLILFTERNYRLFIDEMDFINFVGNDFKLISAKIQKDINNFMDNDYKWKKDLFFNILINFKKSGFSVFKHGPKKDYIFLPQRQKLKIFHHYQKIVS